MTSRTRVLSYLGEIAQVLPELGLTTAEVDALACALKACDDVDTAALQGDSESLRAQVDRLHVLPDSFGAAAKALAVGFTGHGGNTAVRRLECDAALASADIAAAAGIADALEAAATGIDAVRAQLDRRLTVVGLSGLGGQSIPEMRTVLDSGDLAQCDVDGWAAEVRATVDHVAAAAADTHDHVRSILRIGVSSFDPIDTDPYPARIAGTASAGLDLLEAALPVATAVGSLAENAVTSTAAVVAAVAAVAAIPSADDAPQPQPGTPVDHQEPVDNEPTASAPTAPQPTAAAPQPTAIEPTAIEPTAIEPTAIEPVVNAADQPVAVSRAADAPQQSAAWPDEESGLALMGDR